MTGRSEICRIELHRAYFTAQAALLAAFCHVEQIGLLAKKALGQSQLRFRVHADDGCRLYLDGRLTLDHGGIHSVRQGVQAGPFLLSPGPHRIVLDYFEWGGEAGVLVEFAAGKGQFQPLVAGQQLP